MEEASFLQKQISFSKLKTGLIILGDQNLTALKRANFCKLEISSFQPLC